MIKIGSTRIVFLTHRYAIKIPRFTEWRLFLHGLLANMQEVRFSRAAWIEKVCPVLFSLPGGWLNVMPRVKIMTADEYRMIDVDTIVVTPDYVIPAERKPDSFGYYNGRIVAVDYGN